MGPKKKKSAGSGGKKKISKAERLRLQREEEERRLFEEEEARLRAEQELAARLEKERSEREKTERLEAKDQERRGFELAELQELEENFLNASKWKANLRNAAKWEHYTGCDGSPDPMISQEINTFISLWQEDKNNNINVVIKKGNSVLKLIEKLEYHILDTPFNKLSANEVAQYQETIVKLQTLLHNKYNEATEQLLKQANSYGESESGNMEVVIKEKNVTLCIWANLKKNPRFRTQFFYDEEKQPSNGFDLPKPLTICDVAVRILHTHYDHLSPLPTFSKEPPELDIPLVNPEVVETSKGKEEVKEPKGTEESGLEAPKEGNPEQKSDGTNSGITFQHRKRSRGRSKSIAEGHDKKSQILHSASRAHTSALQIPQPSNEQPAEVCVVDLHQFMPVGGIYHFDALKLPPQAKQVKGWTMVEVLDTGLQIFPYTAHCEETEDSSSHTVGLTIQLLDTVIYFEEPLIGRWDPEGKCWRTDDVGDVVYNMKEKEISFKMNYFHSITLLQDAHLNMPYQSWELHSNGPDQAVLTILTTFAEVQIQLKVNECMLASVTTVEDTTLLTSMRGIWMSPLALLIAMKRSGMNIFPSEYSPKYVSLNKKNLLTEITAYQQIALVASAFSFSWSKWNLQCGEDQVIFKACQHLTEDTVEDECWALYMFNGHRAQRLEILENSSTFSRNIAEDTEFHSTLYHLIRDAASEAAMEKIRQAHYLFIDTVYQTLMFTRVLSYS